MCIGLFMKRITPSIDDDLLRSGREDAKAHDTSLSTLVERLLEQTVANRKTRWLDETFRLMDMANVRSKGRCWSREELYRS